MAVENPAVAPTNRSQASSWNGDDGGFWVEHADRFDAGVAKYQPVLLAAAAIENNSRVLDIGCGTGQTTRDAARLATSGTALGVDLSAGMLEHARRRAELEKVPNASFQQVDAQIYHFPETTFDVAISRHGAMFFGDPTAAFTNIGRALRPGGRLVLLTWQAFERQEGFQSFLTHLGGGQHPPAPPVDGPGPFSLSDPARVRDLLSASGFVEVDLEEVRQPMFFGSDVDDALRFVTGQHADLVDKLDPPRRAPALDELRASLEQHCDGDGVFYGSAAWLVTARRP